MYIYVYIHCIHTYACTYIQGRRLSKGDNAINDKSALECAQTNLNLYLMHTCTFTNTPELVFMLTCAYTHFYLMHTCALTNTPYLTIMHTCALTNTPYHIIMHTCTFTSTPELVFMLTFAFTNLYL